MSGYGELFLSKCRYLYFSFFCAVVYLTRCIHNVSEAHCKNSPIEWWIKKGSLNGFHEIFTYFGGADGIRTHGLYRAMVALSQTELRPQHKFQSLKDYTTVM